MATEGNEIKDERLDTHEDGGDDEVRTLQLGCDSELRARAPS